MAYVYVHIKADSGEPFYVGMGKTAGRIWNMDRRSTFHKNIVAKHGVRAWGIGYNMPWEIAQWWEIQWIKALRDVGYELSNHTDGGDGARGFCPSDEWRRKQSEAHTGRVHSKESREKMSQARIGIKFSQEHKEKLSEAAKKRGYTPLSEEARRKISLSKLGKPRAEETIAKMSEALKGRPAHNKGKPHSQEQKDKLKAAWVIRRARMGKT